MCILNCNIKIADDLYCCLLWGDGCRCNILFLFCWILRKSSVLNCRVGECHCLIASSLSLPVLGFVNNAKKIFHLTLPSSLDFTPSFIRLFHQLNCNLPHSTESKIKLFVSRFSVMLSLTPREVGVFSTPKGRQWPASSSSCAFGSVSY